MPKILASPGYKDNGLLIVTYDEAEAQGGVADARACCRERASNSPNPGGAFVLGPGGGKVGAVMVSPFIKPGTISDVDYNHYSLLRTSEDLFGLDHLGYAAQAGLQPLGDDVFNRTPRLYLKTKPTKLPLGSSRTQTLKVTVNRPATVTLNGKCGRASKATSNAGVVKLKVRRSRHAGDCTVKAKRDGWSGARRTVRVR